MSRNRGVVRRYGSALQFVTHCRNGKPLFLSIKCNHSISHTERNMISC
jgi:hypothetical protein